MQRSEIRNLILATLASHLHVSEQKVTEEAEIVDDLGADSLDIVELTLAFEEMFSVEIPDDDLEQITTVRDFINLVDKKVSAMQQEEQNDRQSDEQIVPGTEQVQPGYVPSEVEDDDAEQAEADEDNSDDPEEEE